MKKHSIAAEDIKEIAPYEGEEYVAAMKRLVASDRLTSIVANFFPNTDLETLKSMGDAVRSAEDFHSTIIPIAIKSILNRTSAGLSTSGVDKVSASERCVYISNHRDIVADSALLSFALKQGGRRTLKICLGDNLLLDDWTTDLLKVNKSVIVKRNLATRELLRWSHVLSHYLNQEIRTGKDSIWIAQGEGRTKDGCDKTQTGVIKMLTLEGEGDQLARLLALRLTPVAISYEIEPCGALKVRERLMKEEQGSYEKQPGEDRLSMASGMMGQKGRVHISIGSEITPQIEATCAGLARKDQLRQVASLLDAEISGLYKLWPSNYIAHDLLERTPHSGQYTEADRGAFSKQMEAELGKLGLTSERARTLYLEMYAAPVLGPQNRADS